MTYCLWPNFWLLL